MVPLIAPVKQIASLIGVATGITPTHKSLSSIILLQDDKPNPIDFKEKL